MLGLDIGFDLGTSTIQAYTAGKGLVINEPSVTAVDVAHDRLQAVGNEALRILNTKPDKVVEILPIRNGVISDFVMTEMMLKHYINKLCKGKIFKPRVAVSVPCGITDIEERGIRDAVLQAGAGKVYLVEEPLAAAFGSGIDVSKPVGNMVIDIGGGTTDIAVVSCGGIVDSVSVQGGGQKFDNAIKKYVRNHYGIIIGEQTAETIKIMIGSAVIVDATDPELNKTIEAKGKNAASGVPQEFTIMTNQTVDALNASLCEIISAVKSLLETISPELVSDICENGIYLSGGSSKLSGIDEFIKRETGIKCRVVENPTECVAMGAYSVLTDVSSIREDLLVNKNRR